MTKKAEMSLSVKTEVPKLLEKLNERINNLKHVTECVYKTNGQLETCSIKTETKVDNLIKAHASLLVREEYYIKAAKDLGRRSWPEFSISGSPVSDWKSDIKLRIEVIEHQDTLNKLNEFKDKAAKFLSEEDQKAMLIQEMVNFFDK